MDYSAEDLDLVLDKLLVSFPEVYHYHAQVAEALSLRDRIDTNNLQRSVIGTPKHRALLHDLVDIVGSLKSYEIGELVFGFHERVLDWNQRNLLTAFIKEKLVHNYLRFNEPKFTAILNDCEKYIRDQLPFASIDTSTIPGYVDLRLPENADEHTIRTHMYRMLGGDLDHYHSAYVAADYLNLNDEQKAWYSLYFGVMYRTQWATIAIQLFGAGEAHPDHVDHWCGWTRDEEGVLQHNGLRNFAIIPHGRDTRYNVNNFHIFYRSVWNLAQANPGGLHGFLKEASTRSSNPNENFRNLATVLFDVDRLGRMTTFLAIQQLYMFFDWPLNGYDMFLDNAGTWSSRIGLLFAIRDEVRPESWYLDKGLPAPNAEELKHLNEGNAYLINMLNGEMPFATDTFNLETSYCQDHDKTCLKAREFPNWGIIELNETTSVILEDWAGYEPTEHITKIPDLKPLLIGQFTKRPSLLGGAWLDHKWAKIFQHTGMGQNYEIIFKGQPSVYDHLPVERIGDTRIQKIVDTWNSTFTPDEQEAIRKKYDPRKYLRWYKTIDMNSKYISELVDEEKDFIASLPELEANGELYFPRLDSVTKV